MTTPPNDAQLLSRLQEVARVVDQIGNEVVGNRLRRLRTKQGISIRELATRAEIGKNSISRAEAGHASRPLTILKICTVLGVHLERLAEPDGDDLVVASTHRAADDHWVDMADFAAGALGGKPGPLTARERARAVKSGALVPLCLLRSRLPQGRVLPTVIELHGPSELSTHAGEEFVYVLEGRARIEVSGQIHTLGAGESITFFSAEPHRYAPASRRHVPTRLLSVRYDANPGEPRAE
ncbi:MAG: cupin domain-containing protein [bacterium]|nr:cupin domain-containing protein [bacterium]